MAVAFPSIQPPISAQFPQANQIIGLKSPEARVVVVFFFCTVVCGHGQNKTQADGAGKR